VGGRARRGYIWKRRARTNTALSVRRPAMALGAGKPRRQIMALSTSVTGWALRPIDWAQARCWSRTRLPRALWLLLGLRLLKKNNSPFSFCPTQSSHGHVRPAGRGRRLLRVRLSACGLSGRLVYPKVATPILLPAEMKGPPQRGSVVLGRQRTWKTGPGSSSFADWSTARGSWRANAGTAAQQQRANYNAHELAPG
jgi:hypothetical protein